MGTVYAEITVKNAIDVGIAESGQIRTEDIRAVTVTAIVDTGASTLVINEELCQTLGLRIKEERNAQMADGRWVACRFTEGVEVHWKDRQWTCTAMLIPGANSILLGAIPLEGMDLMVNPNSRELVGIHGDSVELMLL